MLGYDMILRNIHAEVYTAMSSLRNIHARGLWCDPKKHTSESFVVKDL